MNELLAKKIKAHIKHDLTVSPDTYGDWDVLLKSFKVESWKLVEVVEKAFGKGQMIKYEVVTSHKAKKYENNLAKWKVCAYWDNSFSVYFDGYDYKA